MENLLPVYKATITDIYKAVENAKKFSHEKNSPIEFRFNKHSQVISKFTKTSSAVKRYISDMLNDWDALNRADLEADPNAIETIIDRVNGLLRRLPECLPSVPTIKSNVPALK